MSLSLTRQASYSGKRMSSTVSLSRGMQLVGSSSSVYGGAGGHGTRISVFSSGPMVRYGETTVTGNEKLTMQNLNERLASYMQEVRSLEKANRKLELQIREFYEKRSPSVSKDFTSYFGTITELRALITKRHLENQRVLVQLNNAQLTSEDFKIKYEVEQNLHLTVGADVSRLRGFRDSLTISISDLEMQIESLKEELAYMKSSHTEELRLLRIQQSGEVNVEMDSMVPVDLSKVLEEMREQYEAMILKNKMELDTWYNSKIETLQTKISTSSKDVKTFYTQLSELKRNYQSFEISRQESIKQIECLQQSIEEVNSRYGVQLSQLQLTINMFESEQQQLRVSIEQQQAEYKLLLDIKMRLEMEIAEYRRLLDGEFNEREQCEIKKTVVISKVVEVEEHKPHIERRVKTIVEEIIDGQVVATTVDTKVEDIQ